MPNTIADNLARLQAARTAIAGAITAKGGTVTAGDGLENFPTDIATIPSGGGGSVSENDVTFYDYDGTVVNAYSKTDFLALSAMPTNPTHEGLTAQGWNWSIADAKAYVRENGKLNIGHMYITSDGKTRLYITLTDDRTSPILKLYLNANSEIDVDWGDGTAHEALTSTSAGDVSSNRHEYASAGDYIIAITAVSGEFEFAQYLLSNGNGSTSSPDAAYLSSIKKCEIGNSVKSIGTNAFYRCYSLHSITIPSSVASIGDNAFQSCSSLSSITIPSSITSIRTNAFQYCYSLHSITIPSSVTSISTNAFQSCSSLSSITIPSSITSISTNAFQSCYSLSSITIPSSVTSIGDNAFQSCSSLSSITIPSSITSISTNAFRSCYSLSSITIPSSVTSIGDSVFYLCSSLSSIIIPSSVTSIGGSTFLHCYSLSSITINKPEGSITGSPWGATTGSPTYTQIIWTG